MKATRTLYLAVGFALALVLLVVAAVLSRRQTVRLEETAALVTRTYEVQANLNKLLSVVVDIEAASRGFVLTGQPVFLEPIQADLNAVAESERKLEQLIVSDEQKRNLTVLRTLIAERIAISHRNIELQQTAGFDAARQAISTSGGRVAMIAVRRQLARMDTAQQALLDQRSAAARHEERTALLTTTGATGLSGTLFIAMFAFVMRENQLRQRSQLQLDRFFTLSLDMLGIAGTDGYFRRLSPAFTETLGYTTDEMMARPFLDFIHPDDRAATVAEVEKLTRGVPTIRFENRYSCKDGSWKWLSWKAQPIPSEGIMYCAARDITTRKLAEERIAQLNADLEIHSAELAETNKELESFSYSVSHDLRAPLRSIDGFSQILLEDYGEQLNDEGKDALKRVRKAAMTMGELIDALLSLSRVSRAELRITRVDLSALAASVAAELRASQPDRQADFVITPGLVAQADSRLIAAMIGNLLGNAWKYSQRRPVARIEFGCVNRDGEAVFFVRDNGVGFDMAYVSKLFGAFQRLHRQTEFTGTGVGLATVQRIVHRHGGRAWAEGAVDRGATFYFTLNSRAAGTIDAREIA
ncbi:MAG TPA: CHASE3 domain-containing protein [Vicinamibacterales bacterium]|nr:CHASE3 domain-containing protein [Vicinamibacterales bacterium]